MARQSRIDYPGALQHIMLRGIERKNIFKTDPDKENFLKRLQTHVEKEHCICFAYAIMSNHVHLLLQTASETISRIMQSIQTGYAVSYNLRHNRTGKLYQNRFKSVLCDKDEYLLQLVRYIHLNPLKAGIVETMGELDKNKWTSHSIYMDKHKNEWFDTEEVLSNFGKTEKEARKEYRSFIASGVETEDPIDYEGGGLIRSLGGYWEVLKQTGRKEKKTSADERILGSGKFVEEILKHAEEKENYQSKLLRQGYGIKKVEQRVCKLYNISPNELKNRGQQNAVSQARALFSVWMSEDLGMAKSEIADYLGVSRSGMTRLVKRGLEVKELLGGKGRLVN